MIRLVGIMPTEALFFFYAILFQFRGSPSGGGGSLFPCSLPKLPYVVLLFPKIG